MFIYVSVKMLQVRERQRQRIRAKTGRGLLYLTPNFLNSRCGSILTALLGTFSASQLGATTPR